MQIIPFLQAALLGLIQGLTEFIPVSSSAHLIVVPWLFGWDNPALTSLSFDVALHLGTLLAVLAYFAADWLRLLKAGVASLVERRIGGDPGRRLAWLLVIGSLPGAIIGALAESRIERLFHEPNQSVARGAMIALAIMLALLGAALFAAERLARHVRKANELTIRDAIVIGLAQALAIFPGVSRSGATITAGLFRGLERAVAARFSFLMSAPIIAGAGAKSLFDIYQGLQTDAITSADLALFPVGFIVAAGSGFICLKYLLDYLQQHSTLVFVYYRWSVATLIIAVALLR